MSLVFFIVFVFSLVYVVCTQEMSKQADKKIRTRERELQSLTPSVIARQADANVKALLDKPAPRVKVEELYRPYGFTEQEMREDADCKILITQAEEKAEREWREEMNVQINGGKPVSSAGGELRRNLKAKH